MNILITGATSGLGRCLGELMATPENKLAICGRSEEKMNELLDGKTSEHVAFSKCFCVSDTNAVQEFVEQSIAHMGSIDVLINCAGANTSRASLETMDFDDLDYMYQLNLKAPAVFSQSAFKHMKEQGEGKIVNIHSTVCLFSNPNIGAYTATKAGFDALSKVFRKEAADAGVKVINVYPGGINTGFREKPNTRYMQADTVATSIASILALPDDVIPHEFVIRPDVERNFA